MQGPLKWWWYGKKPCGCLIGMVVEQVADRVGVPLSLFTDKYERLERATYAAGGSMVRDRAEVVVWLPSRCEQHRGGGDAQD